MKRPRRVDIDWPDLMRAFERFDPTWEDAPLPYLNLRTGRVSYFGLNQDVDYLDTLDFDRYVALSLPSEFPPERRAQASRILIVPTAVAPASAAVAPV